MHAYFAYLGQTKYELKVSVFESTTLRLSYLRSQIGGVADPPAITPADLPLHTSNHLPTMKTVYYTATSIDGFIADADNSLDWLFQSASEDGAENDFPQFMSRIGAQAMGSTTYEWILDYENLLENPSKWTYKAPTWVFSSRDLPRIEGADIRFVKGDVGPVHEEMRRAAGEKDIWLIGGGDLVGQFHDLGLLDEIIATLAPVMLGSGAPLLPRKITTPPLRLVSVEKMGGVFAKLTYEVRH